MITAKALQQLFNQALTTVEFPSNLKNADVTSALKRTKHYIRNLTGSSVFYLLFQKCLKNDAKSDQSTHKIFFVAIPVWLQKGL